MHIAGIAIHTQPQVTAQVGAVLQSLGGVEIHGMSAAEGKLVATIESEDLDLQMTRFREILDMEGVALAELVYHAFDAPEPFQDPNRSLETKQ